MQILHYGQLDSRIEVPGAEGDEPSAIMSLGFGRVELPLGGEANEVTAPKSN